MNKTKIIGNVNYLKHITSSKTNTQGASFLLNQFHGGSLNCVSWNKNIASNIKKGQMIELIDYSIKNTPYEDKEGKKIWSFTIEVFDINLLRDDEYGWNDLSKDISNDEIKDMINNKTKDNDNDLYENNDLELVNLFSTDDESNFVSLFEENEEN